MSNRKYRAVKRYMPGDGSSSRAGRRCSHLANASLPFRPLRWVRLPVWGFQQ